MSSGTTKNSPSICIVGAGFSGINAGIELQKQLGITSFTIFDNNSDVGGTWIANDYPGCACDVPSHVYSYSFEKNPYWSQNYASQAEIWRYMRDVARKYGLYKHIVFNTEVRSTRWDASKKKWIVVVEDLQTKMRKTFEYDVIFHGPGALRVPFIPEVFKKFTGPVMHSATWDHTNKLDNKVVAVVGSGASAIQIVPSVAPRVKEMHVFQRKAAWVVPRSQYTVPKFLQLIFAYVPGIMWLYRAAIFLWSEFLFSAFKYDTVLSKLAVWYCHFHLKRQIPNNPELVKKLTPDYTFGCKRVVTSNDYYPAMALSNVSVHTSHIADIDGQTIILKDGSRQKVDVLLLATGFKVQEFWSPMEIFDKNGDSVMAKWSTTGPTTYFGITASTLPNSFLLLGPNTGLGHNSILFMIECQVNFSMQVLKEMLKRNADTVTVKPSAEKSFHDFLKKTFKNSVWGNSSCGSYYANAAGEVTALWPESCTSYWWRTKKVDFAQFDYEKEGVAV